MIELMIFGALLCVLFIGGLIADYALPRIGFIARFVDNLPMCREDEEDGCKEARRV